MSEYLWCIWHTVRQFIWCAIKRFRLLQGIFFLLVLQRHSTHYAPFHKDTNTFIIERAKSELLETFTIQLSDYYATKVIAKIPIDLNKNIEEPFNSGHLAENCLKWNFSWCFLIFTTTLLLRKQIIIVFFLHYRMNRQVVFAYILQIYQMYNNRMRGKN